MVFVVVGVLGRIARPVMTANAFASCTAIEVPSKWGTAIKFTFVGFHFATACDCCSLPG